MDPFFASFAAVISSPPGHPPGQRGSHPPLEDVPSDKAAPRGVSNQERIAQRAA
jgi:hypothetical protein